MNGLEYAIEVKGIKKKEVAELLNVSAPALTAWIKGSKKIPKQRLKELSEILNIPSYYLETELTFTDKVEIKNLIDNKEKSKPILDDVIPIVIKDVESLLSNDKVITLGFNASAVIDEATVSESALETITDLTLLLKEFENEGNFNKLNAIKNFLRMCYLRDTSWESNIDEQDNEFWKDLFFVLKKHKVID